MKRISGLIILTLMLLLFALPCKAGEMGGITVIASSRLKLYMQALQGIKEVSGEIKGSLALKTIDSCPVNEIILSDNTLLSPDALVQKIKADAPRVIIAIGSSALEAVKQINDIPIVFVLVPNSGSLIKDKTNITGIDMLIPPEQEVNALLTLMPSTKRIGIVCSNSFSKETLRRLENYINRQGVKLLIRESSSPKQTPKLISDMAGLIDVLWMLPDLDLLTPEIIEHMMIFSTDKHVPILTFSEKMLRRGASIAITPDAVDTGRQAAKLARKVFEKGSASGQPVESPKKPKLFINAIMAKKLNLSLNPQVDIIAE